MLLLHIILCNTYILQSGKQVNYYKDIEIRVPYPYQGALQSEKEGGWVPLTPNPLLFQTCLLAAKAWWFAVDHNHLFGHGFLNFVNHDCLFFFLEFDTIR
jgi:hypothetical protein